jgi:hypothetical protein
MWKGLRSFISKAHQRSVWRGRKRKVRLQGSLYTGWHSAPCLSTLSWKASEEEPPHTGHRVHGGPRRKVCGGHADELGELPRQRIRKGLRKAQDLGYEFHYSWLIILITFVAWKMPEGATFPEIEPTEPLAAQFSTLWYTNDMTKQWQSNVCVSWILSTVEGHH